MSYSFIFEHLCAVISYPFYKLPEVGKKTLDCIEVSTNEQKKIATSVQVKAFFLLKYFQSHA